jgi:hypothetical protein
MAINPIKRKTQIPVDQLPPIANWILKNSTGEQLNFLNKLSNSSDLRVLLGIVDKLKLYNITEVFHYKAPNDSDLAQFRAAKRGEVAAFDAFLHAVQGAKIEIERRKKIKP